MRRSETLKTIWTTAFLIATYVGTLTFLTMTLLSIESWMHLTGRLLMSPRQRYFILLILLLTQIPLVLVSTFLGTRRLQMFNTITAIPMLEFYGFTFLAYFKVFRMVPQHRQRVLTEHTLPKILPNKEHLFRYTVSGVFQQHHFISLFPDEQKICIRKHLYKALWSF